MTNQRHNTVLVDEPTPGRFRWMVYESNEDVTAWIEVKSSAGYFATWREAFEAGWTALRGRQGWAG